ncbi:FAD-dependent monooxygenase [Mycolicibacterium hodleri]|uniref:FAD-dependent oxidoreductase n=1 Tax=Mycolicibacterium hodleri TaxID=49897 RepID=A0A502E045_9MYCO|nr:FAD-dependent monooxygenase [Mycolicibacterium hodleri]TPG31158.1 FAD-dependent oxidoreductase [Mycolicibacterium hodleri]
MQPDTDVLVVGAGPTGLTTAIELARRGIGVRMVDKVMPRPYAESRAEGLHAKSLEIFERQGLLAPVLEQGRVLAGFAFRSGGRRLGELSAGGLDSPHAYAVLLPQSEIERIQIERLAELGVDVQRPVELVHMQQEGGAVRAHLLAGDGNHSEVTARYLVAADGGHSVVRKSLGIPFSGHALQGAYVMDAVADFAAEPPPDRGTFILGRGGFLVVGHRPDGTYRIALSLPAHDQRISADRPTRDELQMLLDDFPEMEIRLRSISWSSAFFISSRAVDRLRHGRVFLAGDAAHIHSPVGGQGMNTGIQDAVNLGWKLAIAIQARGGERLLDSYDAERLPIIRRLIASTTTSTKPLLWHNPVAVAARNSLLRLVMRLPPLQTALFDSFTGFSVRYRSGAFVAAKRHAMGSRGPLPGEIAPEADRGGRRWYLLWGDDTRHQLLIFGDPSAARDRALAWAQQHCELVRPIVVAVQSLADDPDVVLDPTGALRRRYAVTSSGALYLVRPDGYIAARSSAVDDVGPLATYVDAILSSTGVRWERATRRSPANGRTFTGRSNDSSGSPGRFANSATRRWRCRPT